jgi:hypothetical protein
MVNNSININKENYHPLEFVFGQTVDKMYVFNKIFKKHIHTVFSSTSLIISICSTDGLPGILSNVNYKKGCTRLAAASDKVYQLLAHGRWFSPGTPASSTNKTGRHNIAEILLKVALNTKKTHTYCIFKHFSDYFYLFNRWSSGYFIQWRFG